MKKLYQQVWIRIAGDSKNIKEGSRFHWQGYINKIGDKIPISKWEIKGPATKKNVIHGSRGKRESNGLLAWIDMFGDVSIANGIAKITLSEPKK